ncbi:MAG TPA: methionine adenosyltransferase [Terriglobales bacterium]|nr:methionine adenosyltransferase [Terriglobales bacterium]
MSTNDHPYVFTSESVTEGHPDKMCDQISDAVLDAVLARDPHGRVACEVMVKDQAVYVVGEVTTSAPLDIEPLVRSTIADIGYTDPEAGFTADTCTVHVNFTRQSHDIHIGVETGGAGDQGLMFGYACNETDELMPFPLMMAHKLCQRLAEVRRQKILDFLRPDGKAQVTVEYAGAVPLRVDTIVVSTQHKPSVTIDVLREAIREFVIKPVIPARMLDGQTKYHINPTGRFVVGGPVGDSGLTGRKIIVDTYGGAAHHGGGSFSGKDPTKVDRSASYMARHIAKNIVAARLAQRAEVQLAYAIGVAEPVSVMVDTFGTGRLDNHDLVELIRKDFRLTPQGIIQSLDLLRPIYKKTAAYGHFGRTEPEFTWEVTQKAGALQRKAVSNAAVLCEDALG